MEDAFSTMSTVGALSFLPCRTASVSAEASSVILAIFFLDCGPISHLGLFSNKTSISSRDALQVSGTAVSRLLTKGSNSGIRSVACAEGKLTEKVYHWDKRQVRTCPQDVSTILNARDEHWRYHNNKEIAEPEKAGGDGDGCSTRLQRSQLDG